MAFDVCLTMTANKIAHITLSGRLETNVAAQFKDKIEEAVRERATRLVLFVKDLEYIAIAGIRALIFAKQTLGSAVDVYVVSPQEQIEETLKTAGLQYSVKILDEYDADIVENC